MEPSSIGTGRKQRDNAGSERSRARSFTNPMRDAGTIGRIEPANIGAPNLCQAIRGFVKIAGAFMVQFIGTNIEREMELVVEFFEELGRSFPVTSFAAE